MHRVRVIESAVQNQMVRCKNAYLDDDCNDYEYCHQECSWTGKLSEWSMHAARECPVEIVACSVPGCAHKCPRREMKSHVGSAACISAAMQSKIQEGVASSTAHIEQEKQLLQQQITSLKREKREAQSLFQNELEKSKLLQDENNVLRNKVKSKKNAKLREQNNEMSAKIQLLELQIENEREGMQFAIKSYEERRRGLEVENGRLRGLLQVAGDKKKMRKKKRISLDVEDGDVEVGDMDFGAEAVEKRRKKRKRRVKEENNKRARAVSTDANDILRLMRVVG